MPICCKICQRVVEAKPKRKGTKSQRELCPECLLLCRRQRQPGVGLFTLVATPIVMPVVGCIAGVDDAWRGLPFWKLTPPAWREEF